MTAPPPVSVEVLPAPVIRAPRKPWTWTNTVFLGGVVLLIVGLIYLWMISSYITKVDLAARQISENPAMDTAKILARENPDWDVLGADSKTSEITFRNKKSGQETVISYQNGSSGNFSVKGTDGSKMEMRGGKIEISSSKGEKTVLGAGDTAPPAWIPSYPRVVRRDVILSSVREGRLCGSLSFQTEDPPVQVKMFYAEAMRPSGWKIADSTQPSPDINRFLLLKLENGTGDAKQTFNVMASRREDGESATGVQVVWEGAKKK